jgi:hypothetical protein
MRCHCIGDAEYAIMLYDASFAAFVPLLLLLLHF